MVKDTELYDRLELKSDANINDIKKAYKKMALKYHPDKNNNNREEAEKKFKDVSEAYDILSDSNKKEIYDKFGMAGLSNENNGQMPTSPEDIFNMFFGGNRQSKKENKKQQIEEVHCTLEEFYKGSKKNINIVSKNKCIECQGQGAKNVTKCKNCNGTGRIVGIRHIGPGMMQQVQTNCDKCMGKGKIYKESDKCKLCRGNGMIDKKINVDIEIPKGYSNGDHLILDEYEFETNKNEKIEIIIVFKEIANDIFKRKESNLIIEKKINLGNSLIGTKWKLKHISGEEILIEENSIITDNQIKRASNYGMPVKNSNNYGDLIIIYKLIYPKMLLEKNDINKLFEINDDDNLEDNKLKKINTLNVNDDDDDDYNDEHQNFNNMEEGGVQCAQQ